MSGRGLGPMVKKLIAISGSPHALDQTLRHLGQAQRLQRERIARDPAWARKAKGALQRKVYAVRRAGRDPITGPHAVPPHPDDVVVTAAGYRFAGPCDASELRAVVYDGRLRDLLLLQRGLDEQSGMVGA